MRDHMCFLDRQTISQLPCVDEHIYTALGELQKLFPTERENATEDQSQARLAWFLGVC